MKSKNSIPALKWLNLEHFSDFYWHDIETLYTCHVAVLHSGGNDYGNANYSGGCLGKFMRFEVNLFHLFLYYSLPSNMSVTCDVSEISFIVASACGGERHKLCKFCSINLSDKTITANYNNETCVLTPTIINDTAIYTLNTSASWYLNYLLS